MCIEVQRISSNFKNLLFLHCYYVAIFSEFRECFYLFARSGQIRTLDELTVIMRSLGMSPTIAELKTYLKERSKNATFLLLISHNYYIGMPCHSYS